LPTPTALAAIAAATAGASPATAIARRHGTRFIDGESPAFKIRAIEFRDRGRRFLVRGHFDETEAFAAPGVSIGDDPRRLHLAGLAKYLPQALIGRSKRKISNVKFVSHALLCRFNQSAISV